ncbi:glycerol-3-phosphate dehydrogenase [Piscinibacter sp.]|uniref:glycerol-3-phosphate dehydrogenase n=1 Tax=Piscinibacter sp. TaxID=1903157 RepID=UPI002D086D1C|nr:glycerol-3-phosphate dehydrogenase [Albitalea sp.]HUG25755.1 glycerol-3-phosphate dehydrogenase [Albitalea sp.]
MLVVGGGINGAGIARDLAGRGQRVLLCEKDDLAQHTSSSSTKMIHGGIRYLEYYEFSLVRKALAEREVLLKSAPHIIRPLRLVMPHDPSMRPVWMMRIGLFLYDHLARREVLPGSETIDLQSGPIGEALQPRYRKGFAFSDGWVDDARLVVLNAMDAAERGAEVLTRTRCVDAQRTAQGWQVRLESAAGERRDVTARVLVNAAGPWAAQFLREHAHVPDSKSLRLVKGSHIVVRKLYDHDHAYVLQSPDRRIIFVIPYEGEFTLIGTTDVEHTGPVGQARIDDAEIAYLCEHASRYMRQRVTPADVVWSYAGVRPLLEDEAADAAAVTRDYQLDLDQRGAPLLTVWGGKMTTFRKLAEEAADMLAAPLAITRGSWTQRAFLPGGDLSEWIGAPRRPDTDIQRFAQALALRHEEIAPALCKRLARDYGSRAEELLSAGLGEPVAPGLFEAELNYLHRHEWARSADDVLWRRTKLGLHMSAEQREAVADWCATHWDHIAAQTAHAAPRRSEITWN